VSDMMASSDGYKVSQAMFLISHLMWDKEWQALLLSIEPPTEVTVAGQMGCLGYFMKQMHLRGCRQEMK